MAVVMHRTDHLVNNWESSGNLITMPGKKPFNVNMVNTVYKSPAEIPYCCKHKVNTPPLSIPRLCRNLDRYSKFDFANRP